ncbi:MAG TPA: fibrobacter succinogenes major paralogous domain-containing protein [Prolixibacteraceae bacterium]
MKKNLRTWLNLLTLVGLVMIFTTNCKKSDGSDVPLEAGTVKDKDGNIYHSVTIGKQVWMVENLKTTKYNDGTSIPSVTDNLAWAGLTTAAYCWYENNETANKNSYGALYNWFAVNTGKLCPTGWHIPTNQEWEELTSYLGKDNLPGKLKEAGSAHWISSNSGSTNESGFTALPGGQRSETGLYDFAVWNGLWWTSSEITAQEAYGIWIATDLDNVYSSMEDKRQGYSVRCIKD